MGMSKINFFRQFPGICNFYCPGQQHCEHMTTLLLAFGRNLKLAYLTPDLLH